MAMLAAGSIMAGIAIKSGMGLIDDAFYFVAGGMDMLSKVKGVMFWLGVDSPYALHHPKMTPDEAALPFAIAKIGKFLDYKVNDR